MGVVSFILRAWGSLAEQTRRKPCLPRLMVRHSTSVGGVHRGSHNGELRHKHEPMTITAAFPE